MVTQQLLPVADGSGRTPAFEIMVGTDAVLNLIRENKCHQINSSLQTGGKEGMCSLNADLAKLVKQNIVTMDEALKKASDKNEFFQMLG